MMPLVIVDNLILVYCQIFMLVIQSKLTEELQRRINGRGTERACKYVPLNILDHDNSSI